MDYFSNHCWCSKSHWTNGMFHCRHIVSFSKYIDYDINDIDSDWPALLFDEEFCVQEEYDRCVRVFEKMNNDKPGSAVFTDDAIRQMSTRNVPSLKPEVIDWLTENVHQSTDKQMVDQPQGWAMGNAEYRQNDSSHFSIFFLRRRDALNFIKVWSIHKQPTTYFNYFTDDKRKLIDGKLTKVNTFK